jgi:hypothetical protein
VKNLSITPVVLALSLLFGCAHVDPCTIKSVWRASATVAAGSGADGFVGGLQSAAAGGFQEIQICEETDEPPTEEQKAAMSLQAGQSQSEGGDTSASESGGDSPDVTLKSESTTSTDSQSSEK